MNSYVITLLDTIDGLVGFILSCEKKYVCLSFKLDIDCHRVFKYKLWQKDEFTSKTSEPGR